jgi:hypothetical protein
MASHVMLKKGLEGYPAQTCSQKDSKAAWQLKKAVESLFKKSDDLRKLAEDMVSRKKEKLEQDTITFCGIVYPLFMVEFGKETEVKMKGGQMRKVFPTTIFDFYTFSISSVPGFCCLLASPEKRAFFSQVEDHAWPISRKDLEKRAAKVEVVLKRLNGRARRGQEAWVKESGISFWLSEYMKRKFVLDLSQPEKLEKAAKAFKFMREHFKSVVEYAPPHCCDCAWAYSGRCYRTDFPFLYSWIGCDSRDCRFNLEMRAYTDWYARHRVKKQGALIDDTYLDWWNGLEAAVDLSLEYGVYPHELFVIPTARQIFEFRAGHPVLPKRELLKQFITKAGRGKNSPFHAFEQRFEGKKNAYCGFRYQEKDEFRLVGLWLWDRMLPRDGQEEVPLSVIESLTSEDWFQASGLGHIWKGRSNNAKTGGADDGRLRFNEMVREYRDAFALTNECIRKASLLPRKAVKRRESRA